MISEKKIIKIMKKIVIFPKAYAIMYKSINSS